MEHKCINESKFTILEWKLKWNNELTILKMQQIEKEIQEIWETLKEFINKCDDKYATKEEVKNSEKNITKINEILSRLNWILITTVCVAVLALIFK